MSALSTELIHPTSVIAAGAKVKAGIRVGPYCVIGDEVEIDEGCELMAHIFLEGPLRIGPGNKFFPYASIGVIPQDLKYHGERTETVIGEGNTFREFVTVHRGTEGGGGITRIGNGNLIMAYSHIAHDCIIGDHAILANGTTLGGHVVIEDYAVIGAFSGIHQFCRVGRHSLVGGYSVVAQDVLPFSKTVSERETRTFGTNSVGLKRHGFSAERREALSQAFRLLSSSRLNTSQAIAKIREGNLDTDDVHELVRFIEASKRGVIK